MASPERATASVEPTTSVTTSVATSRRPPLRVPTRNSSISSIRSSDGRSRAGWVHLGGVSTARPAVGRQASEMHRSATFRARDRGARDRNTDARKIFADVDVDRLLEQPCRTARRRRQSLIALPPVEQPSVGGPFGRDQLGHASVTPSGAHEGPHRGPCVLRTESPWKPLVAVTDREHLVRDDGLDAIRVSRGRDKAGRTSVVHPIRTACVLFAASSTAMRSSLRCPIVTGPVSRSDKPVPRLSKRITRPSFMSRSMNSTFSESSKNTSMFEANENDNTRSRGPSPTNLEREVRIPASGVAGAGNHDDTP